MQLREAELMMRERRRNGRGSEITAERWKMYRARRKSRGKYSGLLSATFSRNSLRCCICISMDRARRWKSRARSEGGWAIPYLCTVNELGEQRDVIMRGVNWSVKKLRKTRITGMKTLSQAGLRRKMQPARGFAATECRTHLHVSGENCYWTRLR